MREALPQTEQQLDRFSSIHEFDIGTVALIGQCVAAHEEAEKAARIGLYEGRLDDLRQLPGSYSFVVQRGEEYTVDIDPAGQYPLFWESNAISLRFSSTPNIWGRELNTPSLGAYIVNCEELLRGQSFFHGVQRLEGGDRAYFIGNRLAALHETVSAADEVYTMEEAAQALREALSEAIEARLQLGKIVTSDCSGGFDSSALALLLAERAKNGVDALFHSAYDLPSSDWWYAKQVAASHPQLRLHKSTCDDSVLPYQELDAFTIPDAPSSMTVFNARKRANFMAALQYDSGVHLRGDGGDAVLDASTGYLVDMARQGRGEALAAACQAYGRLLHIDPRGLEMHALRSANRTPQADLGHMAAYFSNPGSSDNNSRKSKIVWFRAPGDAQFLTAAMSKELGRLAEQRAAEWNMPPELTVGDFESMRSLQVSGAGQRSHQVLADGLGIESHAPYMDRNVVQACLRLPAMIRAKPGKFKTLLSNALSDVLPEFLQNRKSKGTYDNEAYRGLRLARNRIIQLFTKDCLLADLKVIEPVRVLEEFGRLDMGLEGNHLGLFRAVAAEVWLRRYFQDSQ